MARVQDEGLLFAHFREVLHGEQVLRPILENGSVAAIGNQLFGMLGHLGVEVVLNHQHNGCCLPATGGIGLYGPCIHGVIRPKAIHVNAPVALQLFGKLRPQNPVMPGMKIAQGILNGQFFLFFAENALNGAARSMAELRVALAGRGQNIGDTGSYGVLKSRQFCSHVAKFFSPQK